MLGAAHAMAERQAAEGRAVLLLVGEGWHPGVVGIVAGRMKERFNRPACVAGLSDGMAKGSGRSVPGVDLGAAVIAARQAGLLETGGGHAMAAGFSFRAGRDAEFHAFLEERLRHAALLPSAADLMVEGTLNVIAAQTSLAQEVARLAPFGGQRGASLRAPAGAHRQGRPRRQGRCDGARHRGRRGRRGLKTICFRAKDGRWRRRCWVGSRAAAPVRASARRTVERRDGAIDAGCRCGDGLRVLTAWRLGSNPALRPVPFV